MREGTPYLSIVVTSRNDNHGGDLNKRMQIFVNGLVDQCNRLRIPAELIFVEWNPPAGQPKLAQILHWPSQSPYLAIRIIEVPPERHLRLAHAAALPLFQMIAKNVGIRRARGEFILATNIDILFSEALMQHVAERRLRKGAMYRVDRWDIAPDIPLDADLAEQLRFCEQHLIRVNRRSGSFRLTPSGRPALEDADIAEPASGILFGEGFYRVEPDPKNEFFRWAGQDAELIVDRAAGGTTIVLDIEPGPASHSRAMRFEAVTAQGEVVARGVIERRARVRLSLPCSLPSSRFLLRTSGRATASADPRTLHFRLFRAELGARSEPGGVWRSGPNDVKFAVEYTPRRVAHAMVRSVAGNKTEPAPAEGDIVDGHGLRLGSGWHQLECHGSLRFRWASNDAELLVEPNAPAGRPLILDIQRGPSVKKRKLRLLLCGPDGQIAAQTTLWRRKQVVLGPRQGVRPGRYRLQVEGGGHRLAKDARLLDFRVFRFAWGEQTLRDAPLVNGQAHALAAVNSSALPATPGSQPQPGIKPQDAPAVEVERAEYLHTNACGDFTLLHRDHWFDLRGYPELEVFSMNIDSMFCFAAHHGGAPEVILEDPCRIYHIEHGLGSGWTPEGEAKMYARLAAKGIPHIGYLEVLGWAVQMKRYRCPLIFNGEAWGFAVEELPETLVS